MAQAVAYHSGSDEKMHESEPEPEIDGVDPWKAAMQVCTRCETGLVLPSDGTRPLAGEDELTSRAPVNMEAPRSSCTGRLRAILARPPLAG